MVRVNVEVSKETKERWDKFVKASEFTTFSKFIREVVEFYIEKSKEQEDALSISKYAHRLKEELGSIKGFSQILIQDLKDKLNFEDLKKLNSIYQSSESIENILKMMEGSKSVESEPIDVLIVDDNRDYIELVTQIIKDNNLTYRSTLSGAGALELIKIFSPKLILLDILLPDISGYEVCSKIKQNKDFQHIPIFYITAVPEVEVASKVVETRADGYLLKGFEISEFKKLLNEQKLN